MAKIEIKVPDWLDPSSSPRDYAVANERREDYES